MSYLCMSFGVRTCCKADMYVNRRVGCLAFIAQDIKRESGASPEQSRCCKFTRQCTKVTLWQKSHCWKSTPMGRRYRENKSEDLPTMCVNSAFEEKSIRQESPCPLFKEGEFGMCG